MRFIGTIVLILLMIQFSLAQKTIIWENKKVTDFEYSPDSSLIYAALEKTISAYNFTTKKIVNNINIGVDIYKLDLSKDSNKLAIALSDSTILVYNTTNNSVLFKIKNLNSIANIIKFSTYGNYLLAGLRNGFLAVIDAYNGAVVKKVPAHTGEVTGIALCDNLKMFATCGSDGNVCIWDLLDYSLLSVEHSHSNWARNIVFKDDGSNLYSCGDDGKVISYLTNARIIRTKECISSNTFPQWILGIDYKNKNAVAFSSLSGKIKILLNYEITCTYNVHSHVYKLKFFTNNDDRLIVTVATDNGVQILDAKYFKSRL